jgi:hypothetical protein
MNVRAFALLCTVCLVGAATRAVAQTSEAQAAPGSAAAAVPEASAAPSSPATADAVETPPVPPAEPVTSNAAPAPTALAAQLSKPPPPGQHLDAPPREVPSSAGPRLELSLLSAPLGGGVGLSLCLLADCQEGRLFAASILIGATAGVALSALVTRKTGLAFSTAQAIEGGAIWGTTTPVYVWLLASNQHDPRGLFAGMAVGELLGAGLAGVLERRLRPTSGAVALANSGSFWLSSITTLMTFSIGVDSENDAAYRGLGAGLLAAQGIGLGVGGFLGQRFAARRSQVWLADAGAVLLGGTLPLLTWLMVGDTFAPEALLASTAVGMGVGFVGAYLLAELLSGRQQQALERTAQRMAGMQLSMMPLRDGGGVTLSKRLR